MNDGNESRRKNRKPTKPRMSISIQAGKPITREPAQSGALTVGRGPIDPNHPPVPAWWQPGEMQNATLRALRLDATIEVRFLTDKTEKERRKDPMHPCHETVFTIDPAKPEASGIVLRDDGPLFNETEEPRLWAEIEEALVEWHMARPIRLQSELSPSKLVLPFVSYTNAVGKTQRILQLDRAEYDGTPITFEYGRWTSSPGMTDHDEPVFWTTGPEGHAPYTGPWGEPEE